MISTTQKINSLKFLVISSVFLVLFFGSSQIIFPQNVSPQYLRMKENSRLLFDKWAVKQNEIEGKSITSPERFGLLHISYRSTFAAISNALFYTKLTDPSGQSIGFAIDLIDEIEQIAGQQDGKGGDEQFRLYVKLKPDAIKKLDLSREFSRGKDNSVFHKGFPINYRQTSNAPTLQFSISKDASRADIDVDYRSSSFPKVLFNGHLTAGNSDVRVANNYFTHLLRWTGLVNWWDTVFPDLKTKSKHLQNKNFTLEYLPKDNADESEIVSAVANSFLKSWLVDRDLDRAMSYLHTQLKFCSDLKSTGEKDLLTTRYKVLFFETLKAANKELKKPKTLDQAIQPIAPIAPFIKAIDHSQKNFYTLAAITDGDYEHFVCSSKTSEQTALDNDSRPQTYGKYYVVKFRFLLENGDGGILRLLWTKENGVWKIESFDAVTA